MPDFNQSTKPDNFTKPVAKYVTKPVEKIGGMRFLILSERCITKPCPKKRWILQRQFDAAMFTFIGKKLPRDHGRLRRIEKPTQERTYTEEEQVELMWGKHE